MKPIKSEADIEPISQSISSKISDIISQNTSLTAEQKETELESELTTVSISNIRDIGDTISKLSALRDARMGIITHEIPGEEGGISTIVRDARNLDEDASIKVSQESYAISVLNNIRSAMIMIEESGIDSSIDSEKTKTFLANLSKMITTECIEGKDIESSYKMYNKVVIDTLINLTKTPLFKSFVLDGKKSDTIAKTESILKKKLGIVKQFAGLEDQHHHVSTITSIKQKDGTSVTHFTLNMILDPLSDEGKGKMKDFITSQITTSQTGFLGKIAQRYKTKLSDGNHVIPVQLREFIPYGLKNAYFVKSYIIGKDRKKQQASSFIRQGSFAYDPKNKELKTDATQAANDNVSHLQKIGVRALVNLASSPDKADSLYTKREGSPILVKNPLNFRRILGIDSDYSEAQSIADEVEGILRKKFHPEDTKLQKCSLNEYIKRLETTKPESPEEQEIHNKKIRLFKLIKSIKSKSSFDLFKKNLDFTADITEFSQLLKEEPFKEADKFGVIAINCKSGKDRTYSGVIKNIFRGLSSKTYEISKEFKKTFILAREGEYLASSAGGTVGAFGIINNGVAKLFGKVISYFSPGTATLSKYVDSKLASTNKKVSTQKLSESFIETLRSNEFTKNSIEAIYPSKRKQKGL